MALEHQRRQQRHHLCQRMAEEERRRRQEHHLCLRKALEEQLWLQCQRMAEEHRWRHGVVMEAWSIRRMGRYLVVRLGNRMVAGLDRFLVCAISSLGGLVGVSILMAG